MIEDVMINKIMIDCEYITTTIPHCHEFTLRSIDLSDETINMIWKDINNYIEKEIK